MVLSDFLSAAVMFSNEADHDRVVSISVYAAVLCLCIVVGHLLGENRWVNEAITAMLIVSLDFNTEHPLNDAKCD